MHGPGTDRSAMTSATRGRAVRGRAIELVRGRTDGVPGQDAQLRGLRHGVHLDGGRAALLRRQELQERTETVQELQGQARVAAGAGRRQSARNESRRRPTARRAERKPQCRSVRRRDGRSSAANVSSSGSLQAPAASEVLIASRIPKGHECVAFFFGARAIAPVCRPRLQIEFVTSARSVVIMHSHVIPISSYIAIAVPALAASAASRVAPAGAATPRRRQAAAARGAPPPTAVKIADARAEADRAGVGIHRDAAVAALDDRPAGGRRPGHADLRQVGRPRQRRHAARPDQCRQAAGGSVEHRGQPRRHRSRRRSTGASRSSGWNRSSRPAPSAGRNSIRRRTRCARPRRGSPPSTRKCAKAASSSSTTASSRRRRESSATSRSASATA